MTQREFPLGHGPAYPIFVRSLACDGAAGVKAKPVQPSNGLKQPGTAGRFANAIAPGFAPAAARTQVAPSTSLKPTTTKDTSMDRQDSAVRALQEFRVAEQETAGHVRSTLGMDSAAAVYSAGLTALGVNPKELARTGGTAALRAAFLSVRSSDGRPRAAFDRKSVDDRKARFPNGDRLR